MSTSDRDIDSSAQPTAPGSESDIPPADIASGAGEQELSPGPSDPAAELRSAHQAFLALHARQIESLQSALQAGITKFGAACDDLTRARPESGDPGWASVSQYVRTTRESVIGPLREQIAALPPVRESAQRWQEAGGAVATIIASLSKSNQGELSPVAPFLQALAFAVAHLEAGVSEWASNTLDAIRGIDCRDKFSATVEQDDAGAEQPAEEVTSYTTISSAASEFKDRLAAAANALNQLAESVTEPLTAAVAKLDGELPSVHPTDANTAEEAADVLQENEETLVRWETWFEQSRARIELAASRLAAFLGLADMQLDLLRDISENSIGAWRRLAGDALQWLGPLRTRAVEIYDSLASTGDGRKAIQDATEIFRDATRRFYREYARAADPAQASQFVANRAASAYAHITALAGELPENFSVHAVPDKSDALVRPDQDARTVTLRPAAMAALEATLKPALDESARVLDAHTDSLAEEIDNTHAVLRFHLGAAVEELREVSWHRDSGERRKQAADAARELTLAGIDRVTEALSAQQQQVDAILSEVSGVLTIARSAIWQSVGSQVQAETATQQIALKTRSTVASTFQASVQQVTAAVRTALRTAWRQAGAAYRKALGLVRYGQRAVIGEATAIDEHTTIEAIASLGGIRASLPTVYRRLFSFYPLSDESLIAGRDRDIAWLQDQVRLWHRGRTHAYVLTSTPGSGLTTLINVARARCFRAATVADIDLSKRVTSEPELVEQISAALGIEASSSPPEDLSALANLIVSRDRNNTLSVCIVEHLGHVLMRRIGGTELLGRLLRFFSETDSHIFWLATASDFSWQLLTKNEPLALGLVTRYRVGQYDRASIEEVIMKRHRRSGLPIVFDEPEVSRPLLRRRLRKAESEEDQQALLRAEFFDDLFAASGQNIMLALFYWHLAITCETDPASIRVRPLPRLSFDFLSLMSLPEAFALKALLEHATLTVDEYCEVANLDYDEAVEVFESLGNSLVIEAVDSDDRHVADLDFERVERHRRYRIRPLLVQPVIRYLRGKNIAH